MLIYLEICMTTYLFEDEVHPLDEELFFDYYMNYSFEDI
jgi:hypothetical protein